MPKIDIKNHLTFQYLAQKTNDVITKGITGILNVASKDFNIIWFTMPKIDIKKDLTFEKLVRKAKDVISKVKFNELNFMKVNALNFIKVSENDLNTFDEM